MSKHVIAIDQSTSATKVFLLDSEGNIVRRFSKNHKQFYPKDGYVEHDAQEIFENVREGINKVAKGVEGIAAIGISNQRETTVLWDKKTGKPVCRAVVWQDVRGAALCESLKNHAETIQRQTGIPLSPYFPAAKAASVLNGNPEIRQKAEDGSLLIGTVDSYLIYRLTGCKVFQTDVSNASRTQLMALDTLCWSEEICELFSVPVNCLAKIVPSDAYFGADAETGIPITGVMGDSHAALFGQGCHKKGMAKATYGTGSSVMMNIGTEPALSTSGLATSVGFAFKGQICYVLEGNVTCSGDTLVWLKEDMGLIADIAEAETIASEAAETSGVYLVPAFSGLGAPHGDAKARALICGMNRGTKKKHIIRAAIESIAYQDADVIVAMEGDMGSRLQELKADGGPTQNALLMQFQADLLNCPVQCAAAGELSALGAGYMAGISAKVYENFEAVCLKSGKRYEPQMDKAKRVELLAGWKTAVKRCLKID